MSQSSQSSQSNQSNPMGHSSPSGQPRRKRSFTREQRTTIIYGMLTFVAILVMLQFWLLTATMNAYLRGDSAVILPAAGASFVCFLLNAGLLVHLFHMERRRS